VEVGPRFLEVTTEEAVGIIADVKTYVLLGEDPFFGIIDFFVGTICIADPSILTNECDVG